MTPRRLFGWALVCIAAVNVGLHLPALESHRQHLLVLGALCFAAVLGAVAWLCVIRSLSRARPHAVRRTSGGRDADVRRASNWKG